MGENEVEEQDEREENAGAKAGGSAEKAAESDDEGADVAASEEAVEPAAGSMIHLLTFKQQRGITALLNQPSVVNAALAAGVHEATMHRGLGQRVFREAYRRARRDSFGHAVATAQQFSASAVRVLARLAIDEKISPTVRARSGVALMKIAREGMEIEDLSIRIDDLEAKTNQSTRPWGATR